MNFKREICNGEPLEGFEGITELYYQGKLWQINVVGQIVYLSRMVTPQKDEEINFGDKEALEILANQKVEKEIFDSTPKSKFCSYIEKQETRRALSTTLSRYRK
jgi:hypothetical protein